MHPPQVPLVERWLGLLARAVMRHPRWFVYPQLILFVLCVAGTVAFLEFDTDRDNLVGANKKYHQIYLRFKQEFPYQPDLVVLVESEQQEKNRQFVERLGAKLLKETNLFTDVFYKGDLKMMGNKALLFVPEEQLEDLKKTFEDFRPFLRQFRRASNLVSLFSLVNTQFRTASREPGAANESLIAALPALERILAQGCDSLRRLGTPVSPGINALFGGGEEAEEAMYLTFGGSLLFTTDDVLDWPTFIARLKAGNDPVSRYLWRQLKHATHKQIEAYAGPAPPAAMVRDAVIRDINRLIQEQNIYNPQRFAGIQISPEARFLATNNVSGRTLVRLNRLLLESAFPGELRPLSGSKSLIYLVTAKPRTDKVGPDAVRRLRELIGETQFEVPGLNVGLTGELVLEVDEMAQSQKDTTVASIVSLVLCALIFIYGYQQTGRPLKAMLCLVIGVGYTMGFTTLAVGHLNILTITFVPILVGLAIDFGVHLISRYEEELRHGHDTEEAITKAMVFTGKGIITGCLTTAGAFLAMGLTKFKGIQEMGIICGGGMILCLIPMMTLLPLLLVRGRQVAIDQKMAGHLDTRARLENIWLSRPRLTLFAAIAACVAAALQIQKVAFDYNLLHMQSPGLAAVEYEQKLINTAGKSVLFAASIARDLNEARLLESRFTNLPSVASVESLAPYLGGTSARKQELVAAIKKEISDIHFAEPDPAPVNVEELSQTLYSLRGYLGAALDEVKTEAPQLVEPFESLRKTIQELRKTMLAGDRRQNSERLGAYQRAFFQDLHDTFEALSQQEHREPLKVEDLPDAIRNRFVGRNGRLLLMVYPKMDVWERAAQEEFVTQLRRVDPNVTGTPVQLYEYTTLLKDSYVTAAGYALVAIVILVWLQFRSLACVILALVPVATGSLWMVGLMGAGGVMFNPANIMTLPLVIGIGITNGVHVLNRFAEEKQPGIFSRSTGKAVLVSGLTTIAGFGSLMLGQHQGITSLGYVMSVGVGACMLAGVTLLPAVLTLLMRLGWKIKSRGFVQPTGAS